MNPLDIPLKDWMEAVGLIISGAILVPALVWFGLKFADYVHAVLYERRRAKLRALNQAFAEGYGAALGEYAKQPVQTYRVFPATPDRPKRAAYWEGKSVDEICAELEGSV